MFFDYFGIIALRGETIGIKSKKENNMKATGIVRRIDELGRVVIPKEIRRTLRIREGDPLEIFVAWARFGSWKWILLIHR